MPPPSPLVIATSSTQRLVKEEASYHKELESQKTRLEKLLGDSTAENAGEEGNKEFEIKQERAAIEETRKVFPSLRERISDAAQKLEDQIESGNNGASEAEISKAKEVLEQAKKVLEEDIGKVVDKK